MLRSYKTGLSGILLAAVIMLLFSMRAFSQDPDMPEPPMPEPPPMEGEEGMEGEFEDEEIDPDNLILVGRKNDEVSEAVRAAMESPPDKAVRLLQEIIDKSDGEYMGAYISKGSKSEALYIPAREYCLREIQKLPAGARKSYVQIFGPRAERMLSEALADMDVEMLDRTACSYVLTSAGRRAAGILVDLLAMQGEYYRALYYIELVETFYPTEKNPALSAKKAICRLMLGDAGGAASVRRTAAENMPRAVIHVGGRTVKLLDFLDSRIERAGGKLAKNNSCQFNLFYDSTVRSKNPQAAFDALKVETVDDENYWQNRITETATGTNPMYRHHRGRPRNVTKGAGPALIYPLIADRCIFYKSTSHVAAVDLETGKLKWKMACTNQSRSNPYYNRYNRQSTSTPQALDYNRGRLFVIARRSADDPGACLHAIDFSSTKPRLLWSRSPGKTEELMDMEFASVPLAEGGNVYVAGYRNIKSNNNRRGSTKEKRLMAMCFEAASGRLLWITELCTIPAFSRYSRYMGSQGANISTLVESDGRIFVQSNIGIVASLSAHTGRVTWIKKYSKPKPTKSSNYRNMPTTSWCILAPLLHVAHSASTGGATLQKEERTLIVAPRDSETIQAIDTRTGLIRFEIGNEYPGHRYIAGPWKDVFFTYGKPSGSPQGEVVHAFNARNGKVVMELVIPGFKSAGKAVIADNVLYIPGEKKIQRIKLDTENIANSKIIDSKTWPQIPFVEETQKSKEALHGNILFFWKRCIIAGNRWIRSYPAYEEPKRVKPAPKKPVPLKPAPEKKPEKKPQKQKPEDDEWL